MQVMNLSAAKTEMMLLCQQVVPISLRLSIQQPASGVTRQRIRTYEYVGCVFDSIGETMSMSGDVRHKVNASLIYQTAYNLS
jgi:hypothetical protein